MDPVSFLIVAALVLTDVGANMLVMAATRPTPPNDTPAPPTGGSASK